MGTTYDLYKRDKPEYFDLDKRLTGIDRDAGHEDTANFSRRPFVLREIWPTAEAFHAYVVKAEGLGKQTDWEGAIAQSCRSLWAWASDDVLVLVSEDDNIKHYTTLPDVSEYVCAGAFRIVKARK